MTLYLQPFARWQLCWWCRYAAVKSVWESHVTWGTPVQSFVFLGLLVFELEPMVATSDRQTDTDDRLMPPPPLRRRGHNNYHDERNQTSQHFTDRSKQISSEDCSYSVVTHLMFTKMNEYTFCITEQCT